MGDLAYNYLAHQLQGDFIPHFPDWLGHPSPIDGTPDTSNTLLGYAQKQPAPDFMLPPPFYVAKPSKPPYSLKIYSHRNLRSHFPSTPSPSPSQSSTPEHRQPSLPPHEPSCRQARPFFERIRGKWCCDACGKSFRGRWECKRHIMNAGKRAMCRACGKKINRRDDSLRRHYYKNCGRKDPGRDSGDISLEDSFVHV